MARLGKYAHSFGMGVKAGLEYRVNFFLSLASAISPIVIQLVLWSALYRPGEELFGYTKAQMLVYTVIAQLVARLVRTGFEYEVNEDIKYGGLDRYLVKPFSYYGYRIAVFIGDKFVQNLMMGAVFALALVALVGLGGASVGLAGILAFLAALLGALALNFGIFWCVSTIGFWLGDIGLLFEAIRIVVITMSGGIFPLAVMGHRVETILAYLPFRYTIQFPVELLLGRAWGPDLGWQFAVMAAWGLGLLALGQLLWRLGLRKFAAVGS